MTRIERFTMDEDEIRAACALWLNREGLPYTVDQIFLDLQGSKAVAYGIRALEPFPITDAEPSRVEPKPKEQA